MKEILMELQKMSAEIAALKLIVAENESAKYFEDWIPRKRLMEFLDYGDTQMASLFKKQQAKSG